MHVAIFKTNFLGDNIVFLPVVQHLRRRFPTWQITLITNPAAAPLYAPKVDFHDILTVEPNDLKRAWRNPLVFARWWAALHRKKIDASLVSYDQSSTAHALARLAGGRVRAGGSGLRIRLKGTLTHELAWREGWSVAQWNWEIARLWLQALGEHDWPNTPPAPDLSDLIGDTTRRPGRIVIHAGSKWIYTRWPRERYVELAGRLARHYEVIWINAPETADAVLPSNVTSQFTSDVGALAQLLASASLFIGNHSGPMHVANAVGTPIVGLVGPTDFPWDPLWHREDTLLLRTPGLSCQPCERVQYAPGTCANEMEPVACLRRWSVEAIEAACRDWIRGNRNYRSL